MKENNFEMKNLRKLRLQKKMTQINLSVKVEVSQELISQYELGQTLPTSPNLIRLADYFQCSTDYLLERTDNPYINKDSISMDPEINKIIQIYDSLSTEDKKHFNSYLEHLSKK